MCAYCYLYDLEYVYPAMSVTPTGERGLIVVFSYVTIMLEKLDEKINGKRGNDSESNGKAGSVIVDHCG
ncbi:hypothetical protein L3i20_v214120 [Paenibacillus sp. L3-i20]|nr:hypothetical protein L3i20_v214120 [Paenibacillus sp. L3-i20]